MRVLFVSSELLGSALCQQLHREGHEVKLHIELESWKDCLANIVPRTTDWRAELDWVGTDGLIVFDDVGYGELQDELRARGYRVVGGSAGGDRLELDREFFQSVLASHGVKTLPSYNFGCLEEAIRFVESNPTRWVIKQNGHISDLTYIGQSLDGSDVVCMLESYLDSGVESVHLQQFVEGIEIGIARYFNGIDWVGPCEFNIEHKHLCNGDIGPLTGEMGTLMRYCFEEPAPLFNAVLAPLGQYLRQVGHKGDVDVNCIATRTNVWPLEVTARFGWPATSIQCLLHQSPWGDFLSAIADGSEHELKFRDGWGVAVVIGTPPFPYQPKFVSAPENGSGSAKIVIESREQLTEEETSRLFFDQVASSDCGTRLHLAGEHGLTMQVVGYGADIPAARRSVYGLVNKLIVPKGIYRTDIGQRFVESHYETLLAWGWLTPKVCQ